jgi:tagatose 6-phosphate kinase
MGLESPYHVIVASPNAALDSYYILPQLSLGNVNRADEVIHAAGGKGINLARAVIALEGKVLSLSILGGFTGKYIFQELKRENIPADVIWTENETRRTSTLILSDQMQTTVILESGSGVDSETGNRYIELIRSYAHKAPFLVLTGSLITIRLR